MAVSGILAEFTHLPSILLAVFTEFLERNYLEHIVVNWNWLADATHLVYGIDVSVMPVECLGTCQEKTKKRAKSDSGKESV